MALGFGASTPGGWVSGVAPGVPGRAATPRQRAFVRLAVAQANVFLGRFDEAAPELRAAAGQAAALDAYAGPIRFAEAGPA